MIGPEERNLVNFQRSDRRVVLQQVLDLADTKKKECLRKRWKIKRRNGDAIILRDVFEKIITWVQKFKSVGDIAMQHDPGHASLPWAGFRLLLQVSTAVHCSTRFAYSGPTSLHLIISCLYS